MLLNEHANEEKGVVMLNEEGVNPKLRTNVDKGEMESNMWYLDNGAGNHTTGLRSKFKELDETVTGLVRFEDGSTVNVQDKGSVRFECSNCEEHILREVYFRPVI